MTTLQVCRLCLSPNNLLDVFYSNTSCADVNHLRTCIILCTGINILFEDSIPKYVCKSCSGLCLRLFQFRKLAFANEKALKEFEQIHSSINSNYPVDVNEINDLNNLLFKNSNIEVRLTSENDNDSTSPNNQQPNYSYAVHPSVSNIFKKHENIILPNEVLKDNLNPTVALDTSWEYLYSDCESNSSSENQCDDEPSSLFNFETYIPSISSKDKTKINDASDCDSGDNNFKDEDYTPSRKRKKYLQTISQRSVKRSKSAQLLTKLRNDLSISLHDFKSLTWRHNSSENIFTYDMFFHATEYNDIKIIYDSYLKQDKNEDSKGVNTCDSENIVVQEIGNHFVIENLSQQLTMFKIPIIYEYSCDESTQVRVIEDRKEDNETKLTQLWSGCDVIELNRNTSYKRLCEIIGYM